MKVFRRFLVMLLVFFLASVVTPAGATYDICVDAVSIDGGPFGPHDDVVDKFYPFGDGTFGDGEWLSQYNRGTVTDEPDGCLHLKSPGEVFDFGLSRLLERSEAGNIHQVTEGQGWTIEAGFTVTEEDLPIGQNIALNLICTNFTTATIGVINYVNPDAAAIGLEEGLSIFNGFSTTGLQNIVPLSGTLIQYSDITGNVVFVFDKPAGEPMNMRLSLNGGETFQNRGSYAIPEGTTCTFIVYADPYEEDEVEPTPTPTPLPAGLDSYVCYKVRDKKNPPYEQRSEAIDNWIEVQTMTTKKPIFVCVPSSINGSEIFDPAAGLCCHKVKANKLNPRRLLQVIGSYFGASEVELLAPAMACEPCDQINLQ